MAISKEERRERNRIRMAKIKAEWEAQGLCNHCGKEPPRPDSPVCETCYRKRQAAYHKAKKENRHWGLRMRDEGCCSKCGVPIDPTDTWNGKPRRTCDDCRQKVRNKMAEKRNYRFPEILKRDNYTCQLCGRTTRLCVHHIDGNGSTTPLKGRNDSPENLITLCHHCHYGLSCLRQATNLELATRLLVA